MLNVGNTCFLSAGVGMLLSSPQLAALCLDDPLADDLEREAAAAGSCSLELLFVRLGRELKRPLLTPVAPRDLVAAVRGGYRVYGSGERHNAATLAPRGTVGESASSQQDAGELVQLLLSTLCSSRCVALRLRACAAVQLQLSQTKSCVHSLPDTESTWEHDAVVRVPEVVLSLSLPTDVGESSLLGLLDDFLAVQEISDFRCDESELALRAERTCAFTALPGTVVMQLKRRQFSRATSRYVRSAVPVRLPLRLVLTDATGRVAAYRRVAIVRHLDSGSSSRAGSSGHYVFDCLNVWDGLSRHYDDQRAGGPVPALVSDAGIRRRDHQPLDCCASEVTSTDATLVLYVAEDGVLDRLRAVADRVPAGCAAASTGVCSCVPPVADHVPGVLQQLLRTSASVDVLSPALPGEPEQKRLYPVVPLATLAALAADDALLSTTGMDLLLRVIAEQARAGSRPAYVLPFDQVLLVKTAYAAAAGASRERRLLSLCQLHARPLMAVGRLVAVLFDPPSTPSGIGHFIVVDVRLAERTVDVYDRLHGYWPADNPVVAPLLGFANDCMRSLANDEARVPATERQRAAQLIVPTRQRVVRHAQDVLPCWPMQRDSVQCGYHAVLTVSWLVMNMPAEVWSDGELPFWKRQLLHWVYQVCPLEGTPGPGDAAGGVATRTGTAAAAATGRGARAKRRSGRPAARRGNAAAPAAASAGALPAAASAGALPAAADVCTVSGQQPRVAPAPVATGQSVPAAAADGPGDGRTSDAAAAATATAAAAAETIGAAAADRSLAARRRRALPDLSIDGVALRTLPQHAVVVDIGRRPAQPENAAFFRVGHGSLIPFYPLGYRALRLWHGRAWRIGVDAAASTAADGSTRPEFRLELLSETGTVAASFAASTPTAACAAARAGLPDAGRAASTAGTYSGAVFFGFTRPETAQRIRALAAPLDVPPATRVGHTAAPAAAVRSVTIAGLGSFAVRADLRRLVADGVDWEPLCNRLRDVADGVLPDDEALRLPQLHPNYGACTTERWRRAVHCVLRAIGYTLVTTPLLRQALWVRETAAAGSAITSLALHLQSIASPAAAAATAAKTDRADAVLSSWLKPSQRRSLVRPAASRAQAVELLPPHGLGMRGTAITLRGNIGTARAFPAGSVLFDGEHTLQTFFASGGATGHFEVTFRLRRSFPPGDYDVQLAGVQHELLRYTVAARVLVSARKLDRLHRGNPVIISFFHLPPRAVVPPDSMRLGDGTPLGHRRLVMNHLGNRRQVHCRLRADPTFKRSTNIIVPIPASGDEIRLPYQQSTRGRKRWVDSDVGRRALQLINRELESGEAGLLDRLIAPRGEARVELSRKLSLRKLSAMTRQKLGCLSSIATLHRTMAKSNDRAGRHHFVIDAYAGRLARNRIRRLTAGDHWVLSQISRLHVWTLQRQILSPPRLQDTDALRCWSRVVHICFDAKAKLKYGQLVNVGAGFELERHRHIGGSTHNFGGFNLLPNTALILTGYTPANAARLDHAEPLLRNDAVISINGGFVVSIWHPLSSKNESLPWAQPESPYLMAEDILQIHFSLPWLLQNCEILNLETDGGAPVTAAFERNRFAVFELAQELRAHGVPLRRLVHANTPAELSKFGAVERAQASVHVAISGVVELPAYHDAQLMLLNAAAPAYGVGASFSDRLPHPNIRRLEQQLDALRQRPELTAAIVAECEARMRRPSWGPDSLPELATEHRTPPVDDTTDDLEPLRDRPPAAAARDTRNRNAEPAAATAAAVTAPPKVDVVPPLSPATLRDAARTLHYASTVYRPQPDWTEALVRWLPRVEQHAARTAVGRARNPVVAVRNRVQDLQRQMVQEVAACLEQARRASEGTHCGLPIIGFVGSTNWNHRWQPEYVEAVDAVFKLLASSHYTPKRRQVEQLTALQRTVYNRYRQFDETRKQLLPADNSLKHRPHAVVFHLVAAHSDDIRLPLAPEERYLRGSEPEPTKQQPCPTDTPPAVAAAAESAAATTWATTAATATFSSAATPPMTADALHAGLLKAIPAFDTLADPTAAFHAAPFDAPDDFVDPFPSEQYDCVCGRRPYKRKRSFEQHQKTCPVCAKQSASSLPPAADAQALHPPLRTPATARLIIKIPASAVAAAAIDSSDADSTVVNDDADADSVIGETPWRQDDTLYCVCRQKWDGRFMIDCDQCSNWFHGDCVAIEEQHPPTHWLCPSCAGVFDLPQAP